jgi:hypothetical protein
LATSATKGLFVGEAGKWLGFECIPAYLLILLAWPYSATFMPGMKGMWLKSFVQVFSGGDLLSASLCFLIAALVKVFPKSSNKNSDWKLPAIIIATIFFVMFGYIGVKTNPVTFIADSSALPEDALLFCVLGWAVAILTSIFLYLSYRKL